MLNDHMGARLLLALVVLLGCACGGVKASPPDGGQPGADADLIDAGGGGDGGATAARNAREIVSGSGRVTGGNMTLDVQFGHPVQQKPATGGAVKFEGGAAIKP